MTILAWYTMIFIGFVILVFLINSIIHEEKESRIFSFVFGLMMMPTVIFAVKYLFRF